jgi:hypothetical protein
MKQKYDLFGLYSLTSRQWRWNRGDKGFLYAMCPYPKPEHWEKCPFLAKIASYMPIVQGAAFPDLVCPHEGYIGLYCYSLDV